MLIDNQPVAFSNSGLLVSSKMRISGFNRKVLFSSLAFVFFFAVSLSFAASGALAAINSDAHVDRSPDRLYTIAGSDGNFNVNITVRNLGDVAISGLNITLPQGINVTNADSGISGNTLTCRNISGFDANSQNGAGAGGCLISGGGGNTIDIALGSNLAAGAQSWVRLGTDGTTGTLKSTATEGVKNFTIQATGTTAALQTSSVYISALKNGAIGFDIRNTTAFPNTTTGVFNRMVLNGALVNLILISNTANSNSSIRADSNNTGLVFWTTGEVSSLLSSTSNFSYTILSGSQLRVPGVGISYATGSVNKDSVDDPNTIVTAQNQTLNIDVFDELGTAQRNVNISIYTTSACDFAHLIGFNQTGASISSGNFSINSAFGANTTYYARAQKLGHVQTNCTGIAVSNDGTIAGVARKSNLTFQGVGAGGDFVVGTFNRVGGLNYTVVVNATSELGDQITFTGSNTSFSGSGTLTSSGISSSILPVFSGASAYLNLTGSGTLTINVTGFIPGTRTSVAPSGTSQTLVNFTAGAGTGLPFTVRINTTIFDEAGTALSQVATDNVTVVDTSTGAPFTLAGTNLAPRFAASTSSWHIGLTNASNFIIQYGKFGYVLTNTSTQSANNTAQKNVTFRNSTGDGQGLPTTLKIRIQDQLSQDLTVSSGTSNITFHVNSSAINSGANYTTITANSTVFGYALFALRPDVSPANGQTFYLVNKSGYVYQNTSNQAALSNTSQTLTTVSLPFNVRITAIEDQFGLALTQAAADSIQAFNRSGNTETSYTPINTTLSAGVWFVAIEGGSGLTGERGPVFNVTYNKTGYQNANKTGVTPFQNNQTNITFVTGTNALNFSIAVTLEDELTGNLGASATNFTFSGLSNVSAINFTAAGGGKTIYIPANQTVLAALRVNLTGYVTRVALDTVAPVFGNQTTIAFTKNGARFPGLNFSIRVSAQDELGNSVTQLAADTVSIFNVTPSTGFYPNIAPLNITFSGGTWYIAAFNSTAGNQDQQYTVAYTQTGFLTKNITIVTNNSAQGIASYSGASNGLNYTLRVDVYDQFNNTGAMDSNVTFNTNRSASPTTPINLVLTPNASFRNAYFLGLNPGINPWNISVWRVGFVQRNGTSDLGLSNFTLSNTTQTIINMTGGASCARTNQGGGVAIGNGTAICGGLNYTLEVSAQDELGNTLTLASGSTSFLPQYPVAGGPTNSLTLNLSIIRFSGGKAYLAANSSGTGELLEVNHTGYVRTNTTAAVTATRLSATQQQITYQTSGSGPGMPFPVRVGLTKTSTDQPINATVYVTSGSTIVFAYPTANSTNGTHGNYFFPVNQSQTTSVNASAQNGFKVANNTATNTLSSSAQVGLYFKLDVDNDLGQIDGYVLRNGTTTGVDAVTVSDGTRTATTNSNGYYLITGVTSGTFTVTASKSEWQTNTTTGVSVSLGSTTRANVTIASLGNGTLQGYVLRNGTAVGVDTVTVSDGTRTATTNNAGFYQISNVPPATYTLTTSKTNWQTNTTANVLVTVGSVVTTNLTIASLENGTVQGYIQQNGTFAAVEGVTVSDGTRTAETNNAGFYQITNAPPATYTLTAAKTGWGTNTSSSVVVTVGSVNNVNFTIASLENGTVQGYVLQNGTAKTAIGGATVSDGTRTATTNGAGFFILSNVPPATYTLTASKSGFITNTTSSVVVTIGSVINSNVTMSTNDTTAPVITIISPSNSTNVSSTTPTISFTVTDDKSGIDLSDSAAVAVNVTGLSLTRDCSNAAVGALNTTCTFKVTGGLTNAKNATISIAAKDIAGNAATNTSLFIGVDTSKSITLTLNTSDTSGIADNTYANGWSFTFNLTLGSGGNATRIRMDDFSRVGGTETFAVSTNVKMDYSTLNKSVMTYNVRNAFNESEAVAPLLDIDSGTSGVQSTVTVSVKIPSSVTAGTYTTTFVAGLYSVSASGG